MAVTFADNSSIESWAAAAILHCYVELTIDRTTAQGLDVNDSGSAMMYENGKAVKSASRTVDSVTYNFNSNSETAPLTNDMTQK